MILWWGLFIMCFSKLVTSKHQIRTLYESSLKSYNLDFRLLEPMVAGDGCRKIGGIRTGGIRPHRITTGRIRTGGHMIDDRMIDVIKTPGIRRYQKRYRRKVNQNYPIHSQKMVDASLLKFCSKNFITLSAVGNPIVIPEITMTGFYVSPIVQTFDPTANYIGFAILAIKDGAVWHHDGRKSSYR